MQSVSIVLCTYNGAQFLDEQLRSLRAQRGVVEIVAVDDRSTDDTVAILQHHAREDSRVRICLNEEQLGVVANFERAVQLARGQWIALSDQDDIWRPNKIARLRAAWDGEAVLMHHATRKFRGEPPRRLPPRANERRKHHGRDARRLLYRNTIVGHTTLVRADVARALMPFPRDVPHDWWIGVGAALQGKVQYVDEFLVHYRIHQTNAYHRAGSRVHRLRSEHGLRLALLGALRARPELTGETLGFVEDLEVRLRAAETRRFSWELALYYWRHAALYFGNVGAPIPLVMRVRKSFAAACGAAGQAEVADHGRRMVRRASWRLAAASAAVAMLTMAAWVFRVDAQPRTVDATRTTAGSAVAAAVAPVRSAPVERGGAGAIPFFLRRTVGRPPGAFAGTAWARSAGAGVAMRRAMALPVPPPFAGGPMRSWAPRWPGRALAVLPLAPHGARPIFVAWNRAPHPWAEGRTF